MTVNEVEYLRASYAGYLCNMPIKFAVNLRALLNIVELNSKTRKVVTRYFASLNRVSLRDVDRCEKIFVYWRFIASK